MRFLLVMFSLVLAAPAARAQSPSDPYRNARLPVAERVRDLVGRMTLEEKFWQLFMIPGDLDNPANDYSHGIFGLQISPARDTGNGIARAHADRINAIQRFFVEKTRLGIPIIPFEEAVHGLQRSGATVFPAAIGLAASWDTSLMSRVATAIARETKSRGIRDVLSPVINLANDVRWGRVEETYGEDPYLTSQMALAYIRPFENAGVITTPKHWVANVGEGGRDSYPISWNERELEELFFPPFKRALHEGHARSVMTAYNSVDGSPATQSRWLLNQKLKKEWGFSGFIISDAAATGGATVLHMTEANTPSATKDAFEAGLDVVFQSSFEQHRPYWTAFQRGMIADSIIDASVARVLRAKFELGLFEHPYANADSAAFWNGHADHTRLALEAAREAMVLLRNEHNVLPLKKTVRSVAVIGTDATEGRLGGYSGRGVHPISIVDAIRAKLGAAAKVEYVAGPGRVTRQWVVVPSENLANRADSGMSRGLRGEYFDNNTLDGQPRITRLDARVDFGWTLNSPGRGIPFDWYSVRWTGKLLVPARGVHRIGVEGNDGYRLYLDGKLLIDNWKKESVRARLATVTLAPGSSHDIRLEYFESTGNARVKLVWDAGVPNVWRTQIDRAVAAARKADVTIVVAGIEEGEFRDRAYLKLPGHQEELIARVAASGKPVAVVLVGGSAITMSSWLDRVGAVVDAWYPGERGGEAVADVLFGDYSPAGRLPITFPVSEGQLPLRYNHKPTGRGDDYLDLTGHPLFPFGFGLSYTSFDYSQLAIEPAEISSAGQAVIRCRITNTGQRAGDEVVQLYVRDVLATVARPVMELKGFQRVHLAPGESREVVFMLPAEVLRMLNRDMLWTVEPGSYRIMIGASAKDIRLRGEVVVK